jgi:hypothetical protein
MAVTFNKWQELHTNGKSCIQMAEVEYIWQKLRTHGNICIQMAAVAHIYTWAAASCGLQMAASARHTNNQKSPDIQQAHLLVSAF